MLNEFKRVLVEYLDTQPEVDWVYNDLYWAAISQRFNHTLGGPQPASQDSLSLKTD